MATIPIMPASGSLVLVLNSGSSTVKFALISPETGERVLGGLADKVGTPEAVLRVQSAVPGAQPADGAGERLPDGGYRAVISRILDLVAGVRQGPALIGAGHRVVHGGERFTASVLVDDEVIHGIRSCAPLAPLHNPANLAGIEAVSALRPGLPQVAVFDTAFHQTMPASAFRYAVPEEWYTRHAVRRYGFHGTSYRFVSQRAAELLGRPPGELRLVIAHLGNGCSAAAIRDGVSVDTTMGLTPLEGLVMGTRSGDIDPGAFGYLPGQTRQTAEELTEVLNTRSGLLALSGVGNDMRAVQEAAARKDERAQLALDVFVHRLAKAIAALVTSLARLDALVFTAGIGENSAQVRSLVLARLGFLGLAEDPEANAAHGRSTGGRISRPGPAQALVVPTDEELMIARDTARLVATQPAPADSARRLVMARTLLVAPVAESVSLARTCLGLLRALDRAGVRIAFLKPAAQPRSDGSPDRSADLVAAVTTLRPPEPLSTAELERQLGDDGLDIVLEKLVATWEPTGAKADVGVVEGLSQWPSKLYITAFNQAVARALDADVLLVGSWSAEPDGIEGLAEQFAIAADGYGSGGSTRVTGCVVHAVPPAAGTGATAPATRLTTELAKRHLRLIAAVPYRPELSWLRVQDLVRELKPEIMYEGDLSRRIKDVAVFAQGVPSGLHVLDDGRLIVVPGDRHEVLMAACLAALNGTPLAGVLLSAGIWPDPRVWELARAAAATSIPVLLVESDSYQTATRVRDLDRGLAIDDVDRIEAVTNNIADALDPAWLQSLPSPSRPRRLSPAAFRYQLTERARAARALVVLPEGTEPRTVRAAVACADRGIARSVLLGAPDQVTAQAGQLGLRLPEGVTILDPRAVAERYVAPLAELRRHKGWTEDVARDHLADPVTVGTMMVKLGEADGLVSGAVHTTADTVRPALQILGTKPGARLVSSIFFMCLPDEVVIYGDCAINPQPGAEDLADIAVQSAASARAFGIEPRVAMISFSTGTSGTGSDVDKVAEATKIVGEREPGLAVDGPLQYDAAAIASVGLAKRPGSPVAGRATVFIFPDLDTGNTTYKAVQRSAQVVSIGPMLQGLAKPVNDLSRGALVEDIIYTIALTAIQSRAI